MTEALRNEIVKRWQAKQSQRQSARDLQVSRSVVARVLAALSGQRAGHQPARPRRRRQLDAYADVIKDLLGRYPAMTAQRVFEELRRQGYAGSYTRVRVHLQEVRPRAAQRPVIRFETGPGAQAQMDYSPYDIDFSAEGRRAPTSWPLWSGRFVTVLSATRPWNASWPCKRDPRACWSIWPNKNAATWNRC